MFWINELTHLLLSLLVGFIAWKIWGKFWLGFVPALLAGFFIDVDHLFDYFLYFGWNFNLGYFIEGYHFLLSDKLRILLHGWEYAIIMLVLFVVLYKNPKFEKIKVVLFAAGVSLFFHLTADSLMNEGLKIQTYSVIYRVGNNFEIKKLVTPEHYQKDLEKRNKIK